MDTDDKKDNALLEAALPVTEHSKTAYGHSSQMAEDVTIPLTPQTDDPDTPALTFRSVFIGTIWAVILASLNILFSFRTNPFSVPSGLAQLISYPMGIFFAWSLPRGFFNPGPFSVKEHVLIYVIAASAGGLPYGVDNVVMQYAKPLMADPNVNFWNSLAWVSVTQMIGYGVAGICRRFLVKPSAMLWPVNLPYVALFTALNGINTIGDQTSKYSMSRYGYFWLVFFVMFVWQWLPGFFMSTLGGISLLCLISSSKTARFLGSSSPQTGVGILSFSLDWSNIVNYNPVPNPWWATVNFIVGRVFWMWIVVPMCYYFNVFGSPVLTSKYTYTKDDVNSTTPFGILNSPWIFNRNGKRVYVRRPSLALGAKDTRANYSLLDQHFKLDQAKYEQHSPFYLTDFFAITYLTSFINIATIISHVYLW